ncbi:MAG: DUF5694 domain-containing protein, partial [Polymorphobacter sp.]
QGKPNMFKRLCAAIAVAVMPVAVMAAAPVQVMVLGSYHFGNPGLDVNNVKVDSVLTPERQAELAAVARALAEFKPTHVMVEMQSDAPDFAIAEYARFDDAMLASQANEIVQIGYRTARVAGIKVVNGIDEQPKAGEPDYFPYDKVGASAAKFGQSALLTAANAQIAPWMKAFEAAQKSSSVAQLLTMMNAPGTPVSGMAFYYDILPVGDADDQAGADLNAAWYLRNAKIFGKAMHVAKPGDRVLIVYGAGHGFWLRHFAQNVSGYQLVDPLPYLARANLGISGANR